MISNDEVIAAYDKISKALDVAITYKRMFHEMQEDAWKAKDECVRRSKIIERQREVIRKLEERLGIDQDL